MLSQRTLANNGGNPSYITRYIANLCVHFIVNLGLLLTSVLHIYVGKLNFFANSIAISHMSVLRRNYVTQQQAYFVFLVTVSVVICVV
mgnify:FL=1